MNLHSRSSQVTLVAGGDTSNLCQTQPISNLGANMDSIVVPFEYGVPKVTNSSWSDH